MKILIEIPGTEYALVMASQHAGTIAQLLSESTLVKSRGWGENRKWAPVEDATLALALCDEKRFDFSELSSREKSFQKEYEEANTARWQESSKRSEAEKRVKDLEAQLALVKSITKCEVEIPAPPEPSVDAEEVVF